MNINELLTSTKGKLINNINEIAETISLCNVNGMYAALDSLKNEILIYNAKDEKEKAGALSNAKMLYIVAISMALMYTVMQCFFLYGAYVEANTDATHSVIDVAQISCILLGAMFVVLGNFMPKTRLNGVVGLRIVWSMHNDVTWAKSNRFAGVMLMIVGLMTIITAIFADFMLATGLMLIYLFVSLIIMLIYSYKVYKKERN